MATYLDLANELLREMNEVELTSSSFASAVGIQQHVKDSINRAYLDIVNEEPQWPFLAINLSGETDPMYGSGGYASVQEMEKLCGSKTVTQKVK